MVSHFLAWHWSLWDGRLFGLDILSSEIVKLFPRFDLACLGDHTAVWHGATHVDFGRTIRRRGQVLAVLAIAPLVASFSSRLFLGEAIRPATLIASLVAMLGVLVIVAEAFFIPPLMPLRVIHFIWSVWFVRWPFQSFTLW